jgi:hypothetical protein
MEHIKNRDSLVIRSPEDAVSAVPYLLGFHPVRSLVAVGYGGPHGTCALRSDLPRSPSDAAEVAERLAEMLVRNRFEDVLLIGYGPGETVTPVAEAAGLAVARHGLRLREMLRVDEGRWWSYLCGDPSCCPPDGTPFDIRSTTIAAQATVAGQVALSGRDELAATVAPVTGPPREAMRQATERAEQRLATAHLETYHPLPTACPEGDGPPPSARNPATSRTPPSAPPKEPSPAGHLASTAPSGPESPPLGPACTPQGSASGADVSAGACDPAGRSDDSGGAGGRSPGGGSGPGGRVADQRVTEGVPLVRALLGCLERPEEDEVMAEPGAEAGVSWVSAVEEFLADDDLVAWLGVVLTHIRVRDEAWVRIDADRPGPHIALWREVLRRVEPSYAPGPACLLAYAAFLAGDGGLANVALDRADQVDPRYTMAGLLRDVMQAGLPPTAARLRMTPDDLAEAWEHTLDGEEAEQEARR